MMSVLNQSGEDQVECPLCMEPFEVDDLNFFPCTCGYQICRFCWHRIRTDENGLCPACRKAYPENPADFKPLSQEEVARLKAEKRHKDQQRKQKITENRKHLANVRVVQRNLVFVVGLPMRLADAEVLKKHEYFGKFGKIHKVVINQSTSYAGSQGPSASAYVTYHKADDALRAIQAVNNISVDGRTIKTSLGTTKYCSHFMKNQPCPKPDCMYLHDLGDAEASFTKEEMQQGKHQEYEKKLHEQLLNTYNHSSTSRDRKPTPSPPAVSSSISSCQNVYQGSSSSTSCSGTNSNSSSATCVQGSQACNKEAWPSLQPGLTNNSSTNGNNFGLSSGGNGNSSSSSSNNNNNSNNNNSSKGDGSQRRQRFDQQSTKLTNNIHKKRHTSGEESRGKAKEKLQSSLQDEVGSTLVHSKSQHSESRSLSSHDLHQNLQHSPRSSNNSSSSSSSDVTNGPTVEADLDVQESDDNLVNVGTSCTVLGANGRQQLGSRILPVSHRTTLFEPDNNSFFSNNNFTKLAATSTGAATTDWPINGLTLTHMPDVLPPVHSSEDWQAAFGFTNSTNPPNSQHQENNCIVTSNDQQVQSDPSGLSSKMDSSNVDHGFESNDQQQSQNFKNSLEKKSSSVESVVTQFPPSSTSNLNEDFRVNTNSSGHSPQKIDTDRGFEPEEGNLGSNSRLALQNSVNPTLTSNSIADGTQQMFPHSPSLVHQDATILMMHHHQFPISNLMNHIAGPQHIITNGLLPPSQATSKFLADFHMRQQQNQNLMKQLNSQSQPHSHLQNHSDNSFVGRNKSNVTNVPSVGGKISTLGGSDFNTGSGGGECKVNSENNLHNGGDINSDFGISDEEKYLPGFLNHQQKNMESSIDLDYENRDGNSMNLITVTTENSEETSTKDSGRLTDDELGFDPFHETQKALAEMMEKENMVLMVQGQQNRQQPPNDLLSQTHLHNQHSTMSHLTHHLYQQCQLNQMGHFSHQVQHAAPAFGGSKLLGSFSSRSQQHILPQQNHRLPQSVSGCAKLLDGLGIGPSNVTPVGPSAPARTRLPPPGFTTAPNHMNAFGLGIPRAPSNNSSKILPFMGLGNNSSNNGSSSPIPQTVSNLPNNIAHSSSLNSQQGSNQQSVLFSANGGHSTTNNHTLGLQNGVSIHSGVAKTSSESFTMKEWPENVRSLLPNLNGGSHSQSVQFASTSTPLPPPAFRVPHAPVQGNTQKGWSGVGTCTDWTTLDPAIVSSSRPQNYLAVTSSTNHHPPLNTSTNPGLHLLHNTGSIPQQNKPPVEQQNTAMSSANPPSAPVAVPQLHQLQQNNVGHWLRSLSSEDGSCVFYSSNVLGGSSADWAANTNHSGNVNGQQQQNRVFYGSNILGGNSADWAASSNHLGNANGQQQQNHVGGSPNSGSVTMSAPPPPGFSSMRLAAMQQGTATASCIQKKQSTLVNTDMGKIEIPDVSQSESGILQNKEVDRIEDLR